MNLKRTLVGIANVVAEEAARNPEFRSRLEEALGMMGKARASRPASVPAPPQHAPKSHQKDEEKRRGGRRSPAVLDPVDLVAQGEEALRTRLGDLDLERLHDIVAQYGMDPGKLVMKWKDRDRVIDRIVEVAMTRATKGDAFRRD
jgi:hypothetical protein